MGRVAEGTEIGVVRRDQENGPSWPRDPMEFLDGPNHVFDVLNQMDGPDLLKRIVAKR